MAPSGHAVGDDGGEQRFDRAEQRERDRVGQYGLNLLQAEMRQRGQRKVTRNSAELRPNGLDGQLERDGRERSQRDNDNIAGQRGRQKRKPANSTMLVSERPTAAGESVEMFDHRKGIFSRSGPGSAPLKDKPSSGLISPEKIVTAMPAVKPTVTG